MIKVNINMILGARERKRERSGFGNCSSFEKNRSKKYENIIPRRRQKANHSNFALFKDRIVARVILQTSQAAAVEKTTLI